MSKPENLHKLETIRAQVRILDHKYRERLPHADEMEEFAHYANYSALLEIIDDLQLVADEAIGYIEVVSDPKTNITLNRAAQQRRLREAIARLGYEK